MGDSWQRGSNGFSPLKIKIKRRKRIKREGANKMIGRKRRKSHSNPMEGRLII